MKATLINLSRVFALSAGIVSLTAASASSPYIINVRVFIHTPYGVTLSAIVVRPRLGNVRRPTALVFTIYPEPQRDLAAMEYASSRGYVGVTAYVRGKDYSPDRVVPYEDDARDANSVIDWIAAQPWSDGRVGMFGGSYNGFTQWAAAKFANPHLKTIVPWVPNNPGNGLPLQNNVFLLANYAWIYYVTDNKFLDNDTYNDPKWRSLPLRWYDAGLPYQDVDKIAGMPNPWLHKWLAHPAYDAYWQSMVPYRRDYVRITIPVLTIAGYYGDSSAIPFFIDFQKYNPNARNFLVMGPWDHFGTQGRVKPSILRGYRIDPVAHIDTWKLTFDWLDYVMRGTALPALVSNRINYEVMGENVWRHVRSLAGMGLPERLYLSKSKISRRFYLLTPNRPTRAGALAESINLTDRQVAYNDSYPDPILGRKPDLSTGYSFLTRPFSRPFELSGFDGSIDLRVNKRDVDIGLGLYEMLPDGRLFQLSYDTFRASYAWDMSRRRLLTPNRATAVPFQLYNLFSRLISKGDRLLLTVNVNINPVAEINYGTGKDVSYESIKNAEVPMRVQWLTDSYIRIRSRPVPSSTLRPGETDTLLRILLAGNVPTALRRMGRCTAGARCKMGVGALRVMSEMQSSNAHAVGASHFCGRI